MRRAPQVFIDVAGRLYRSVHERVARHHGGSSSVIAEVTPGQLKQLVFDPGNIELTAREWEIALLLAARATNAEIAKLLGISSHTARHHTQHILEKFAVRSRARMRDRILAALTRARANGLESGTSI